MNYFKLTVIHHYVMFKNHYLRTLYLQFYNKFIEILNKNILVLFYLMIIYINTYIFIILIPSNLFNLFIIKFEILINLQYPNNLFFSYIYNFTTILLLIMVDHSSIFNFLINQIFFSCHFYHFFIKKIHFIKIFYLILYNFFS